MNRRILMAFFAVAALALTACDGNGAAVDDGAPTPTPATPTPTPDDEAVDQAALDRLVEAVENTESEGTADFTMTFGSEQEGATGETSIGQQLAVEVDGQVDFDADQRQLRFEGPQGRLTALIDGDDLYVQIPAAEGGEWAHIQLDALAGADAEQGPVGLLFQDPQATLSVLREAAVEVREADRPTGTATDDPDGTEPTPDDGVGTDLDATPTPDDGVGTDLDATPTPDDGVATDLDATPTPDDTENRDTTTGATAPGEADFLVVLDLTQVDEAHAQFRQMAEQLGAEEVEVEVWLDDQDRVEQVRYTLPTAQARIDDDVTGDGATPTPTPSPGVDDDPVEGEIDPQADVVVTIRYHNFGTAVDIEIPDEDDIVEIDEGELRRGFGRPDGATADVGDGADRDTTTDAASTPTPTPTEDDDAGTDT